MSEPPATAAPVLLPHDEPRESARRASSRAGVHVYCVSSPAALHDVAAVLDRVWGAEPGRSVMQPNTLMALAHTGNYVAVAQDDAETIGACVGFFGDPASPVLHSHFAGVLSGRAGRGVGMALKMHQRAWCLERGISTVSWTYDPLVARNAYLNLHRLNARATAFHPDFYGPMTDPINAGDDTDRFWVEWDLDVAAPAPFVDAVATAALVVGHDREPLRANDFDPTTPVCRVDIPTDINLLRSAAPEIARQWRTVFRDTMLDLLGSGWQVTDFHRSGHYVLQRDRLDR